MPKERLISLDAFRGLTVAAMVLVNNPASWSFVYAPLRHAPWHGWTPTDLDAQERALEVGRCGKRLQNAFLTLLDGGLEAQELGCREEKIQAHPNILDHRMFAVHSVRPWPR